MRERPTLPLGGSMHMCVTHSVAGLIKMMLNGCARRARQCCGARKADRVADRVASS